MEAARRGGLSRLTEAERKDAHRKLPLPNLWEVGAEQRIDQNPIIIFG